MTKLVEYIAVGQEYSRHLGMELVSQATDEVVMRLPYQQYLGIERVNGGAIASLVDTVGTCACWSHPRVGTGSRGATVGFSINYLKLVVASDLLATARVRRRGGSICVAEVTVCNAAGEEVALATITYKLDARD